MYTNNNVRFPIGDNGDEIDLIEMLARECRCKGVCNEKNESSCGCDNKKHDCTMPHFHDSVSLASVYSPDHAFDDLYDVDTALERATLFRNLDKPFMGTTVSGGNCR